MLKKLQSLLTKKQNRIALHKNCGVGVWRDNIAIANFEIRTADLLAAKAELERQQEKEKLEIEEEVLNLLLDYKTAERKHE